MNAPLELPFSEQRGLGVLNALHRLGDVQLLPRQVLVQLPLRHGQPLDARLEDQLRHVALVHDQRRRA
jgi:hypothetical protein